MRLVFYNPHISAYGKTVSNFLIRAKNFSKYRFMLDHYIKNPEYSVAFLLDPKRTSLKEIGIRFFIFHKFFVWLEMIFWLLINGISPFRHKIYFSIDQLNPKKDLIFTFARNSYQNTELCGYDGIVLNQMTHYFRNVSALAPYIKQSKKTFLIADTDLTHNDYFHHFFPNVSEVYQLPFTFSSRFKRKKPFSERVNKCLAIGSLVVVEGGASKDFIDYFGEGQYLHPMRGTLYEHRDEIQEEFDVLIFKYYDNKNLRKITSQDPLWAHFAKTYFPYSVLSKLFPNEQASHLKLDLCTTQNNYRMFVCGEEIVGLPSNNFVEGMACGTAFVGIDHPMYTELGLKNGTNYIAYKEGDLEHLRSRVAYYQKHSDKLEAIADAGYRFVQKHFSEPIVADRFWKDLARLMKNFSNRSVARFKCSFKNFSG